MALLKLLALQEELEALRREFQKCAAGTVSPELKALFEALILIVHTVLFVLQEKATRKTSVNSSFPASRTTGEETSVQSGSRGEGPKAKAADCAPVRVVRETRASEATHCLTCGESLAEVEFTGHERRTRVDLTYEVQEVHVDAEIKTCPHCHTESRGVFPKTMPGRL